MRTARPHYKIIATLPETSANHRFAKLVAVFDDRTRKLFTSNTCDVHERLAPWDGGEESQYDHDEIVERLLIMHGPIQPHRE
jgi:hypothetical protein